MMDYEEFVLSIKEYLTAPLSSNRPLLIAVLIVGFIILSVWLFFYFRKEYEKEKAETDTFNSDFADNLDYPGFHHGGVPIKEKEKLEQENNPFRKPPAKDPWGDVNDEY